MALDQKLQEEMKTALFEEKARLESELSRFAKPTSVEGNYETEHHDIGRDPEENATEVEMYVGEIAVEENLEKELNEVNKAIARIERGSYGVCYVCGKNIEEGRLRAYPAADDCMEHAK